MAETEQSPSTETVKTRKSRPNKKFVWALILIAALILAFSAGYVLSPDEDTKTSSNKQKVTATVPATDLRAGFVVLGLEHTNLLSRALSDAIDGSKDADVTKAAVYNNAEEMSLALGAIHGSEFQSEFKKQWTVYLDQLFLYAKAVNKNDVGAQESAKTTINSEFIPNFSVLMAKTMPSLTEMKSKNFLRDMTTSSIKIIDLRKQSNYTKEVEEIQIANRQIEAFFSSIAEASVTKSPEKFEQKN